MQNNNPSFKKEVFYSTSTKKDDEVFIPKKYIQDLQESQNSQINPKQNNSQTNSDEKDIAIDAFVPNFDSSTNNPYMARDVFFPKEQGTQKKEEKIPPYLEPLLNDIYETSQMCKEALKQDMISNAQQLYSMLRERLIGLSVHKEDKKIINKPMKELFSRIELTSLETQAKQLLE